MKKTVMKKRVRALRSGNYKQGTDVLRRTNNHFCCLGVLCDIAPKRLKKWKERPAKDCFAIEGNMFDLPLSVQTWAGMNSINGKLPNHLNLIEYNDSLEWSFEEIADIIEASYESL